jgi:glucose/arabinose dehydrogenase
MALRVAWRPGLTAGAPLIGALVAALLSAPTEAANQRPSGLTLQPAFASLPPFSQPVALLQAPGDSTRWFVAEKGGVVRVFANDAGVSASSVFADITRRIHTAGELEAGLLGMAFDPRFGQGAERSRFVYLFYTAAPNSGYRLRSTISRFTANAALTTLDPGSEVRLIGVDKLESNHNGGHLLFGPDGFLYAGFGEGGGDPHPEAQDDRYLFGKIVRINPAVASGRVPYTIPADNPNAGNPTCNASGRGKAPCPEVWARGLRNPWRFSFDRSDGRLWVGDVGWGRFEEVDIVTRGANYGWPVTEGAACVTAGCDRQGLTDPVYSLPRDDAQSITGGFVYRGTQATDLVGQFIFADFESKMFGAVIGGATGPFSVRVLIPPFSTNSIQVSSFGEASDGELFALDFVGGRIRRLVFSAGGGAR